MRTEGEEIERSKKKVLELPLHEAGTEGVERPRRDAIR